MPIAKMELVDNAHQWKRWWSMRWIILTAVIDSVALAWAALPADWTAPFPDWIRVVLASMALSTTTAAAVSRVLKQPIKDC